MHNARHTALAALAALALLLLPGAAYAAPRSPTLTAPTHFAKVNGARIAYRSFGSGPPVVMVMGHGGTMDAWDPAFVDPLARHHRIVMLDNRGAGRSGGDTSRLSIHQMAEDAFGLIHRLRLRNPAVLGWSMGGFITQDLAIHHPRVIGRIVLMATGPPAPFFVLPAAGVIGTEVTDPSRLSGTLFPPDQRQAALAWIGRLLKRGSISPVSAQTVAAQQRAIVSWVLHPSDDPKRIRARALVADGADDPLTVPANSRLLARRIRHAQLKLYPDAAHAFLAQYHAAFSRAVLKFLAR